MITRKRKKASNICCNSRIDANDPIIVVTNRVGMRMIDSIAGNINPASMKFGFFLKKKKKYDRN